MDNFAEICKDLFYCVRKECRNSAERNFGRKFQTHFCNDPFPDDPKSELLIITPVDIHGLVILQDNVPWPHLHPPWLESSAIQPLHWLVLVVPARTHSPDAHPLQVAVLIAHSINLRGRLDACSIDLPAQECPRSQVQRTAKGASGKGPRQKTSKIVKKCQKYFRHFSTCFEQGKKRQESSKSVKNIFRHFSGGTSLPAPFRGLRQVCEMDHWLKAQ